MTEAPYGELSWLLQNLGARVDHVRQAVVLSADGLAMGTSPGLTPDDADHLSALAAGRSGRPSSSWTTRCCSSPPPGRARAWRCWPTATSTPAWSLTR